jgi:hypothetical protein
MTATTIPAITRPLGDFSPGSATPAAVFWTARFRLLRIVRRSALPLKQMQRALYSDRRTPPRVAEEVAALVTPDEFALLLERHKRVAAYFERPSAEMRASPTQAVDCSEGASA